MAVSLHWIQPQCADRYNDKLPSMVRSQPIICSNFKLKQIFTSGYGKCSKISNTLKLRTPKIIAENNF